MSGLLAKSKPNKAAAIASLLMLGLWDSLTPNDREAFCERGEIIDTPGGILLYDAIAPIMDLPPRKEPAHEPAE